MRRYAYAPDAYDQPPETDPAPVPCTNCGRTEECGCGDSDDGAAFTGDARRAIEADGSTVPARGAASGPAGLNPASPYPDRDDAMEAGCEAER